MEYRCIKDLIVNVCDDDGFSTNKEMVIKAGSTWVNDGHSVISAGDIHLESLDGKYYLSDVYKEDLDEYFEPIK